MRLLDNTQAASDFCALMADKGLACVVVLSDGHEMATAVMGAYLKAAPLLLEQSAVGLRKRHRESQN